MVKSKTRTKTKINFLFYVLIFPCLSAWFFVWPKVVSSEEKHIVINEIMTGEKDKSKNEFVELYNPTDKDIDLKNYKLTKKTSSGNESNLISSSNTHPVPLPTFGAGVILCSVTFHSADGARQAARRGGQRR